MANYFFQVLGDREKVDVTAARDATHREHTSWQRKSLQAILEKITSPDHHLHSPIAIKESSRSKCRCYQLSPSLIPHPTCLKGYLRMP